MRTMAAKDAKNHFGELLLEAQKAPVTIEKNGKPVAVLLSYADHEEIERLKLDWLKAALDEAHAAGERGEERELTDELVDEILAQARALAVKR